MVIVISKLNMVNWGYKINKDNQVDFDSNSREKMTELLIQEPSFNLCISCGTCTATCSSNNFTTLNLRKINILLSRGEVKNLKEVLSQCMLCGKCTLACPRGVNTRNLILNLLKILN